MRRAVGEQNTYEGWRTDGWKYRGKGTGVHETRHEAVGEAAIWARKDRERRVALSIGKPSTSVLEATGMVAAFKPYICSCCLETFLTNDQYDAHKPCPLQSPSGWVSDRV